MWELALDHRPHITDEPLDPLLIRHKFAITDEANPWRIRGNARAQYQGMGTIWDDMDPLFHAKVPSVVFAAHCQNVKSLLAGPLSPTPNPSPSEIEQAACQTATRLCCGVFPAARKIINIKHGMRPSIHPKPIGGPDGVNPYKIMLLNQLLHFFAVRLANCIGVRCHIGRSKLVSKPFRQTEGPAQCDWQRAYDPANLEFALGSAHRFFFFNLGGDNHERYIAKTA